MSLEDYKKALKLGEKEYHSRVVSGKYPYLPALMDMLPQGETPRQVNLGLVDIPMDRIAGTYTAGRQNAFAANWMPLLDTGTEFASKWSLLCDAHISEGIHDPIIAYEYMNYFYVQEGNKRVSVMSFFGADSIPGMVIRILPKKTEDKENIIYYEFVDFYAHSKINYIEFSQPGRYAKLLELLGMDDDHDWTDIERETMYSLYTRFKKAFLSKGGAKLPVTIADALLVYIEVKSFEWVKDRLTNEIKEEISGIWSEFVITNQETPVEHLLEPIETEGNLIQKIIPQAPRKLKVAFINDKSPETSAWTNNHELGRQHLDEIFIGRVETTVYNNALAEGRPYDVIEQAIADGNRVIFTTTPQLAAASLTAAAAHPEVKIMNCSLNYSHSLIRTYYARFYEVKFLAGIVAGALADENVIGYVADYPIFGTTADINAFALGAAMSNPRAKIILKWSAMEGSDPVNEFRRDKIKVVSGPNLIRKDFIRKEYGLFTMDDSGVTNVALTLYNWGKFYETIIRAVLNTGLNKEEGADAKKSLNYWWGLDAKVVDFICSLKLGSGTRRLLDIIRRDMTAGRFTPFEGEIIAQNGIIINTEGRLTPEQMVNMNWLCENVVGEIPTAEELRPDARNVVMLQGIQKAGQPE